MAEDLLDLARLESGHLAVDPAATDLCAIIDQAVQADAAAGHRQAAHRHRQLPDRLDLHADPHRLRQVADNLLSNAINTPPPAAPSPSPPPATIPARSITWTVSDTGIGIPPAERPRLFRRFYRASTALDRRIPGTGLGLVITRTIIERHHGTIDLAEHTGPGTTFTIQLPTKQQ